MVEYEIQFGSSLLACFLFRCQVETSVLDAIGCRLHIQKYFPIVLGFSLCLPVMCFLWRRPSYLHIRTTLIACPPNQLYKDWKEVKPILILEVVHCWVWRKFHVVSWLFLERFHRLKKCSGCGLFIALDFNEVNIYPDFLAFSKLQVGLGKLLIWIPTSITTGRCWL